MTNAKWNAGNGLRWESGHIQPLSLLSEKEQKFSWVNGGGESEGDEEIKKDAVNIYNWSIFTPRGLLSQITVDFCMD